MNGTEVLTGPTEWLQHSTGTLPPVEQSYSVVSYVSRETWFCRYGASRALHAQPWRTAASSSKKNFSRKRRHRFGT